jgi:hypothetical protein
MNREDIIRMAREAGGADITSHGWTSWVGTQSTDFLERFAALVAAHVKKPWVGLTKEEAKEISLANRPYVIDMIAALEAMLKEKNT